jgi:putative ABC transport system permease protein
MSLGHLVVLELKHRPLGVAIGALSVAAAVAIVIFLWGVAEAGERETRIIQRNLGPNLLIVPDQTTAQSFFATGVVKGSMDESFIDRVADQDVANRLIPMIRRPFVVDGTPVIIVGIAPERFKHDQKMKPVFGMDISPSTCVLGNAVARELGGEHLTLNGQVFTVANVLAPSGTEDDARVYLALSDAQRLLGLEGKITEIRALECHCGADVDDPVAWLEAELGPLLPNTRVLRLSALAEARRQQRLLADRYLSTAGPVVLVLCAGVVCLLAVLNVRERRKEIGVLRAIGYSSVGIALAIQSRAALTGILGAIPGIVVGAALIEWLGPSLFTVAFIGGTTDTFLVVTSLVLAPVFAMAAAIIPTALAMREDPAEILREA